MGSAEKPKLGGNRGNAGKGRPKGSPNKATAVIKDAITSVYASLQEGHPEPHGHFLEWAKGSPTEFYKLASKLIPLQLSADEENPIHVVQTIRREVVDPSA